MDGDIELEEIQVVEVTGRSHRDKTPKTKKGSCDCTSSLRMTTILIFALIFLVCLIILAVGVVLMFDSLESLDVTYSNTSVNRLAMMIATDMEKLKRYTLQGVYIAAVGYALRNYSQYTKGMVEESVMKESIVNFEAGYVNTTDFFTFVSAFDCSSENNYYALLDMNFNTIPGSDIYYPGDSSALCSQPYIRANPPIIKPETYRNMVASDPTATGWLKLYVPDEGDTRPLMLSFEPVQVRGAYEYPEDDEVYGYLVLGRNIFPRLPRGGQYIDDVPTCITLEDGKADASKWDEEDNKAFEKVKPGMILKGSEAYGGLASFAKRSNETINATSGRLCPSVSLFNSTSTLMVGYMKLCGLDPEVFGDQNCMKVRVDRPTSFVEEGTTPVVTLCCLVVALMIVISIIFIIFLDCVVLRRIENLSNVIRSQTRGHAKAQEEEDEATATMSIGEDDKKTGKHGKSGKSSKSRSGRSASGTSETSDSSATNLSGPSRGPGTAHDEMGNLKRAMEQNAVGLRKRLEAVNDNIKLEQQKMVHHKQAMQLLNLWCGRKDFFPGLRPNAMQLRYEPTRNLDDLLNNSLAIEYLKSHCESDRTLENLWFVLDVSWLQELENAEDDEESPEKRAQIHDVVVCAAKTIVKRYIAMDAPQQINISSGTYKKLREVGERYSRKMFDDAVSEVKLMLNTDILPRFQKTSAYSAMSETLYIDSSGGGESSSELSDETVSTAGSILTDEEEGEGGVGRIFAKTFKNLHTAFDVGHDDSSSYSGSSSRVTNSATGPSVIPDSQTETTTAHGAEEKGTVQTSTKDESSESSEKEPPKITEDKKEKEKEEPKNENVESSDSSSHSLSSDSLTESSSSGASDESD